MSHKYPPLEKESLEVRLSPDDYFKFQEEDVQEQAERLQSILVKLGQFYSYEFNYSNSREISNIRRMRIFVEQLREAGMDIGDGNAKYGYRMPLPQRGQFKRFLEVFLRK